MLIIPITLVASQNNETYLFLSPLNIDANINDEVELNITVKDVVNLYGFQLSMNYDPNVLNFTGMTEGDFLKSDGASTFVVNPNVSIPGIIRNYIVLRTSVKTGVAGEGVLAKVKFKAKNSGISKIGIFGSKLVDQNSIRINHTVQNSSINIVSNISLLVFPQNLIFGNLNPGKNSSIKMISLIPGNSDLIVSVNVTQGLFTNILFNITGNYNIIGSENINLLSNSQKDINGMLFIPIGYHSGNYTGTITYTAMAGMI